MQDLPNTDPHSVIDRLAPMTSPGNPWRSTALELTAAARLEAGDKSGALKDYKTLADDLRAPQGRAPEPPKWPQLSPPKPIW